VSPSTRPRLQEARLAAGLTQAELAERVGCHRDLIVKYQAGYVDPSVRRALLIARELGVTVEQIWGEDQVAS
jgi:putative transcriptional regulator